MVEILWNQMKYYRMVWSIAPHWWFVIKVKLKKDFGAQCTALEWFDFDQKRIISLEWFDFGQKHYFSKTVWFWPKNDNFQGWADSADPRKRGFNIKQVIIIPFWDVSL